MLARRLNEPLELLVRLLYWRLALRHDSAFRRPIFDFAPHELIEQGHGESRIAVRGAVDHSFLDEASAQRISRLRALAQGYSDFT